MWWSSARPKGQTAQSEVDLVERVLRLPLVPATGGLFDQTLEGRRLLSLTTASAGSPVNPILLSGGENGVIEGALTCSEWSFASLGGSVERLTAENLETGGGAGRPNFHRGYCGSRFPSDTDLESVRLTITSTTTALVPGSHDLAPAPLACTDASDSSGDALALPSDIGDESTVAESMPGPQSSQTSGVMLAYPNQSIVDGRDVGVYSTDAFLGSTYCTLLDTQQMGRWKIADVAYSPFTYDPVTGKVLVVESGQIELNFKSGAPLPFNLLARTQWDSDAAEMIDNFPEAIGWYHQDQLLASSALAIAPATEPPAANFVIVTTSDIVAGSKVLDAFVAMKEQLGWSVDVATEADWGGGTGNAASENIRAWLQANYAAMGIEYVMLVGNPDPGIGDVPMKMTYPGGPTSPDIDFAPTDYYYADLTSNWDANDNGYYGEAAADFASQPLHEVQVGRIPVYNRDYATLDSILNKTMAYQSEDDTACARAL